MRILIQQLRGWSSQVARRSHISAFLLDLGSRGLPLLDKVSTADLSLPARRQGQIVVWESFRLKHGTNAAAHNASPLVARPGIALCCDSDGATFEMKGNVPYWVSCSLP